MASERAWIPAAAALALTASGASAQTARAGLREVRERVSAGMSLVLSVPQGDFGTYVGEGGGMAAHVVYSPGGGVLGLRFDGGFALYGLEFHGGPWPETRTDAIWFGGVGPQLTLGTAPFTPYLHAGLGFSYFATTWSSPGYASTIVGHTTGAWYAGGGARIELSRGRFPLSLDLNVRYIANGNTAYLAPNVFTETHDGLVPATLYGDANLLAVQVGVSVAIP